jgi:hypothetical protein
VILDFYFGVNSFETYYEQNKNNALSMLVSCGSPDVIWTQQNLCMREFFMKAISWLPEVGKYWFNWKNLGLSSPQALVLAKWGYLPSGKQFLPSLKGGNIYFTRLS